MLRLLLDNVRCNGRAAVLLGRGPLQVDMIFVPVRGLRLSRSVGLAVRILGGDGLKGGQRRRFALLVDSAYPEVVVVSFLQMVDPHAGTNGFSARYPASSLGVLLLHSVVRNLAASIVFGLAPLQREGVLGDVVRFERPFWGTGHVHDGNLDRGRVSSVDVLGGDLVSAAVAAFGVHDAEFRQIVFVDDLEAVRVG